MNDLARFRIEAQPDDITCGPTCLHAVYQFHGDAMPLADVIGQVRTLEEGGTLAVLLALHALRRGYQATIHTFNLHVFDPSWMELDRAGLIAKLKAQALAKHDRKLRKASLAYIEFLQAGGILRMDDPNPKLIRGYLNKGIPVLTGLSATWLYQCPREIGEENRYDDVAGTPMGHFVVLAGYDAEHKSVRVADPLHVNPGFSGPYYDVGMDRLIGSILLGIVTYDANLLILTPH